MSKSLKYGLSLALLQSEGEDLWRLGPGEAFMHSAHLLKGRHEGAIEGAA